MQPTRKLEGRNFNDRLTAMFRQGLRELRAALYPESNVAQPPEYGLYVVRPPGQNVPGKVRALIDVLAAKFGGEPVWDRCMMKDRDLGHPRLPDERGREDRPRLAAIADPA